MPTAIRPPKMLSGANAATFSGHSTAISYGPPLAHEPPNDMTVVVTWARSEKLSENRNHEPAEPTIRTSTELRQGAIMVQL